MRKLSPFIFIIAIMAGAAFYYFYYTVPEQMLDNSFLELMENETPSSQKNDPSKLDPKELLQTALKNKNIKVDELIVFVEGVELAQVDAFMEDYNSMSRDHDQFDFQYIKTHFDFGDFPIDSFETEFDHYFDPVKMKKATDLYEKNKTQLPVIFPMMKESAIRYLKQLE